MTQLDLNTLIKASQAIAGEIVAEKLISKMMQIVIENAGAQRGCLLLEERGKWMIEAARDVDQGESVAAEPIDVDSSDIVPRRIIYYVARSQEIIVLENASKEGDFDNDSTIQKYQSKSVLCIPLINQGSVSGILYLENNLATGAFTPDRVELLKLLSSQIAVALDNAKLYANLEKRVKERTYELSESNKQLEMAKDQAEAANQAKSIFLAGMSHELRTPLNAILGFSELLAREKDATPNQREKLAIINRSGQHLLAMINDVLDLSKIEAERVELKEHPFDLVALTKEISMMIQSRATEKGLSVVVDADNVRFRYVMTDVGKLRQILINLLGNAVKFTDDGGVVIRCATEAIPGGPEQCNIMIEVEDTGPGIATARQSEIFEPFVLGIDAPERRGTGLGLSLCKKYVELMGGTIEIESEVGQGSLFRVRLPAQIADAADVRTPVDDKTGVIGLAPSQKTRRILVADDNRENLLLLKSLLEDAGFVVLEAKNGQEAVAAFKKALPDLVCMDMRMPIMDGYEAARQIRKCAGGDTVPIIAITASAFSEQRPDIFAAGCNEMVAKPFRAHEIFEAIARFLDIAYLYEQVDEAAPAREIELTSDLLAGLPPELLKELDEACLSLDTAAISTVIGRIEPLAADTANGLRALLDNFEIGRIRDLLMDV
jgi:signal transduction histidine kinase/FixJ family two-component response regulator